MRRVMLALGIGVILVVVAGVVFATLPCACGPEGLDTNAGAPIVDATLTPTPTLPPPTPVPTPVPTPAAVPGTDAGDRVVIAKAGVNAPITLRAVPSTGGILASPKGADDVVFYDFSAVSGFGGFPGGGGNAVFSGHVDYGEGPCKNGTVPPPCTAVFWDIDKLEAGDIIEVHVKGAVISYRVTGSQDIKPDDQEKWDAVWASTPAESITLVTCGGDFNRTTHEYTSRHVVAGVRV